jgi:hypothetical protein
MQGELDVEIYNHVWLDLHMKIDDPQPPEA